MEAISRLEQLRDEVTRARAVPLSASCVVNRKEILEIVDAALDAMPADIARAGDVLAQRDQIIDQATAHARKLVEMGQAKQAELVAQEAVFVQAKAEADAERARAEADALVIRERASDYVDAKLAQFEVVLSKIASTVAEGRSRLSGRSDYDALPSDRAIDAAAQAVEPTAAEQQLPVPRDDRQSLDANRDPA